MKWLSGYFVYLVMLAIVLIMLVFAYFYIYGIAKMLIVKDFFRDKNLKNDEIDDLIDFFSKGYICKNDFEKKLIVTINNLDKKDKITILKNIMFNSPLHLVRLSKIHETNQLKEIPFVSAFEKTITINECKTVEETIDKLTKEV